MIFPVEVGVPARVEPPPRLVVDRAVLLPAQVVVLVFRREPHVVVASHAVSRVPTVI